MKQKMHCGYFAILFMISILVVGCSGITRNGNSSQNNNTENLIVEETDTPDEVRNVVFRNSVISIDMDASCTHRNELHSVYEMELKDNVLYAFEVVSVYSDDKGYLEECSIENIKKVLLDAGFVIIKTPSEKSLVFAGTIEQLEFYFKDGRALNGWHMCVMSSIRPDMEEILAKTGWKEGNDKEEWFTKNFEDLVSLLGTSEQQVIISVPVILSEY